MQEKFIEKSILSYATNVDQPFYRQLLQKIPAAVYTCDRLGFITFYNDAAAHLWGRHPKLGEDLWCGSWKIFRSDGSPLPLDSCPMAIAIREKRPVFGEEIQIQRPDGKMYHVIPYPQPLIDIAGNLIGAMNMLVDITVQKNNEKALVESEARFRALSDSNTVMLWMTDPDSSCTYLNKGWCEFTGMSAEKALGVGWMESIHPEDLPSCRHIFQEATREQKSFQKEYRLRRRDGEYRWVVCQGIPRYSNDNTFLGYTGSSMDINDRRMASEELEKRIEERTVELKLKNDELERSNRELASFSYVASHDLQEPLRKIITFADRLQGQYKAELPQGAVEYLDKMVVSSKRMTRLIEDLLNFSRVSRSTEKFVWTDLHEIVKNVLMDFDQRIAEKKARISISKLPVVTAIPLQMHQLFYNLISNALKFTKSTVAPVIRISYRSLPEKEKTAFPQLDQSISYCEIKVEDNGIGFDDSFSEQIFTIFQRLHGKSEFSGTGIGLALCRKIAETHKGYIYACSKESKGATFVVLLPADL